MFTSLSIENFKSWRRIEDMRLAPITALFGTNSSGKTGILQLLLLLKQTKESSDRAQVLSFGDANSYANLGTFRDIIFGHDTSRPLKWRISWHIDELLIVSDPEQKRRSELFSGNDFTIETAVSQRQEGRISAEQIAYEFSGRKFSLARKGEEGEAYRLSVEPEGHGFRLRRTQGRPWELPGPIKFYGFPDQVRTYYQNAGFLADLELEFEQQIDNTFYLGPLREFPKREYLWTGVRPVDVGRRGERAVDALIASRSRGETISRGKGRKKVTLEQYVAQWLSDFGLIESFKVEELAPNSNLYRVKVKKDKQSPEALITDVGFGVSQVLPVLVLLYYVPEGATILFEQPEIHLHPLVQSVLADAFIDAIKTRRIQIIVESHSEHLLKRLQRRLAEGALSKEDTAFYFCEIQRGESVLSPLNIDLYGNITNWPKNFFGDEFEEIAAMQEAALRRRIKDAG